MSGETTSAQNSNASPPELNVTLPLMSDLPKTSFAWSNVELPVDILLLAVEDCKFLSCFAYPSRVTTSVLALCTLGAWVMIKETK